MENQYIVKALRRHGRYQYFMGFHDGTTPIITFERDKAKSCDEKEANDIIILLSGPYTKFEKERIN
jgi:hypothetical protein